MTKISICNSPSKLATDSTYYQLNFCTLYLPVVMNRNLPTDQQFQTVINSINSSVTT